MKDGTHARCDTRTQERRDALGDPRAQRVKVELSTRHLEADVTRRPRPQHTRACDLDVERRWESHLTQQLGVLVLVAAILVHGGAAVSGSAPHDALKNVSTTQGAPVPGGVRVRLQPEPLHGRAQGARGRWVEECCFSPSSAPLTLLSYGPVSSYGTGAKVNLPGPTPTEPNM